MIPKSSVIAVVFAVLLSASSGRAQERLCDTAFEDCRGPLWALIDSETVGIDVAFWFMQDTSYVTKLINKHNAGVPVRVIVDPRANPTYSGNQQILEQLRNAGIPMRYKVGDGILHWKMMLFAGQNKVEFSGANFSPSFFVPTQPYTNYIDEAIYFTNDPSIVQSFKKKYDDLWTDTVRYGNFGNITGTLVRHYPTFPISPEMNFPPSADGSEDFFNRTQVHFNQETQKIDVIMYRITNQRYTDTTIAAVNRGIPVRLLHEPNEYRNLDRQWDSWNVDRLFMAGVQIKMRKHIGLNHEKAVILYSQGLTIFGSSNWTGPSSNSQEEHNYFTTKPWFFQWYVDHFERKWNSTSENEPFVPLPPSQPAYISPANATSGVDPTLVNLKWEGGPWAHKYDIYFGTAPNPPLYISNVSTAQSGALPGQPLLDRGSVDNGVTESFTLPITLQAGTTYYWRIVGKTMANVTASGPTWSFVTLGSEPPPQAPSALVATAVSPNRINLSWNDVSTETGYRVERSPNGSNSWTEIASLAANVITHADLQVLAQQTYYYRVRALNTGGFSPYSNIASATTPQPPPPTSSDVVLWAAEAPLKVGNWSVTADATAAGGNRLWNPDAGAPKVPNARANPSDYFEMTFNAQAGTDYRLWLRGKAQNDLWANDSVFIQFSDSLNSSGNAVYRIGTTSAAEMNLEDCSGCGIQGWGWQDNGWGIGVLGPLIRFQQNGSHTLRIQVREDGLSIDQIVLSPQTYLNAAPGPLRNDTTILPKSSGAPPAPPVVNSVAPNSGPTTGGTSITISGTGFQPGATVSFGGTAATNVAVVNSSSITALTPSHAAGTVNVVVTNSDGQSGTLTNGYTFLVPPPPPVVNSITPNSGSTAGGTSVSISGSGFLPGATVLLGGATAANVVVVNSSSITVVTPAHAAGVVNVVVTNTDGQNGTKTNGYTFVTPPAAPAVNSITPNSGSTVGGTSINISGSGFLPGATVSLGGTQASSVAIVNSSSITALTPAHVSGQVDVVVTNTDGQSGTLSQGFTYVEPQTSIPQFDHVFVLVEENQSFENVIGSASMPYLNTLANRYGLAINYFANTQPSIGNYFWLTTGQVITNDSNFTGTVTVDNIVRQMMSSGKTWKSYAQSLPSVGYTGGNQYPYVKRHNPFAYISDVLNSPTQTNNLVPFTQFSIDIANNQLPHYAFIIPDQQNNAHDCPAAIPSCTNEDKLVAADNWLRTNIDPLLASPAFRQNGLLVITFDESVNTDLQHGGGHVTTLVISPRSKQSYQSNSFYQHQSTLRLTAEALGLSVYPGASSTAPNMSEFFGSLPNTAPIITGISPASGPTAGGMQVTISGTGFASGATVNFGGTPASSVNVIGSTSISLISPPHAGGSVNVVVTNPGGQSATQTNGYLYVAPTPPPTVSGVTPNSGTTAGGTSITINGSQFSAGATVRIGGTSATNVTVVNSTTITAITPAHAAGSFDLVVTNADGQANTLSNGFTFSVPSETVLLSDDFNNGSLNTANWSANNLFSGFTDATVAVVETQFLEIGPLKQNVGGSHYNGIRSVGSFSFTGGYSQVQIVQASNSNTTADAFYTLGRDVDNCYRIYVEAGSLILQSKLSGIKRTLLTTSFNPTNHAFWRIRHDSSSGQVVFETAPENSGAPGEWTQLYAEAWNTASVPLGAVSFELKAGTWQAESNTPGTVKFDNFKAARP